MITDQWQSHSSEENGLRFLSYGGCHCRGLASENHTERRSAPWIEEFQTIQDAPRYWPAHSDTAGQIILTSLNSPLAAE